MMARIGCPQEDYRRSQRPRRRASAHLSPPLALHPGNGFDLTDDEVFVGAAEDKKAVAERARHKELLEALHESMVELKKLDCGYHTAGQDAASGKRPFCLICIRLYVLNSVPVHLYDSYWGSKRVYHHICWHW